MPVNPRSISWKYTKKSGILPSATVEVKPERISSVPKQNFQIIGKPNWLSIALESEVTVFGDQWESKKFKIAVNATYANVLGNGEKVANIGFKYIKFGDYTTDYLTITLEVIERAELKITPQDFTYTHTRGQAPPVDQVLSISTPRSWNIVSNQSWLTFSRNNGTGNASVYLKVDPQGLPNGLNRVQLVVDDGDSSRVASVILLLKGSPETADFLRVSTPVIEFKEEAGEPSQGSAPVVIDSSLPVTLSKSVNWINLSADQLPAGKNTLTVTTAGTAGMQIGAYPGVITVVSSHATEVISVLLSVVEKIQPGIESNSFYYADDRNTLGLATNEQNTEAVLNFVTQNSVEFKSYTRRFAFLRNTAKMIIGQETAVLLQPQILPDGLSSRVFTPIKPIIIDMDVFEKSLITYAQKLIYSFRALRFINGRTPRVNNVLTHMPTKITVPADGVIAFSFIGDDTTADETIKFTGDYTSTITYTNSDSNINCAIIQLANYEVFPNKAFTIQHGNFRVAVQTYLVELRTNQIIWLNEWDCPEVFNITGKVEIIHEDESTTTVTSRDGREYTKIIETKAAAAYRINTGFIYTQEEAEWLGTLMQSKKAWIQFNAERVEVVPTFNSLSVFETRRFGTSFTLTFDKAIK